MNDRLVHANGVQLCVETFGDARDPAILLISGSTSSMDWWPDEFCSQLAAGLRFVIRYDHRDTGRSISYPPGAPAYSFPDLVDDAVGLLDVLGISRAHVVGISMGGMIAQHLAVNHADRVESLTLMATSPAGPGGPGRSELPPMTERLQAQFAAAKPRPDATDRAAFIDHVVDAERAFAGSLGTDEPSLRKLAGRAFDRAANPASATNHWILEGGGPVRSRLGQITAPTLVMHGAEDPLFPLGHAEALVREIPGAQLLPLKGVGHQMPPASVWDVVIPALLRHTSGGWEAQEERIVSRYLTADDPTGWFDRLYCAGADGQVEMPWARTDPHPLLVQWAEAKALVGAGRRAVVVGCGLGADAEYVAGLGYDTVAFDIAETAVRVARERFPDSTVQYGTADLLDPPARWLATFDLVVEIITVQALPEPYRGQAIVNVGRLVAPGGTLIAIAAARHEGDDAPAEVPPFPLTRVEVDAFATDGLAPVLIEDVVDPRTPGQKRWRAEFRRG
jgi:pimeloyl-ACP methyl ester carboxylesterase/SAM-dependent methyltransferase